MSEDSPSGYSDESLSGAHRSSESNAEPEEVAESATRRVLQAIRAEIFEGPLPHPETLLRYKEVFSECPERIVQMAELQAAHRRDLEKRRQKSGIFTERLGMVLAFVLALTAVAGGLYLVAHDKELTGFATFFSSIVILAGLFVRESRKKDKLRGDRRRELLGQDQGQASRDEPSQS